jgi:hypothetical protein
MRSLSTNGFFEPNTNPSVAQAAAPLVAVRVLKWRCMGHGVGKSEVMAEPASSGFDHLAQGELRTPPSG